MKWIIGPFALLLMMLPLGMAKADMVVAPGNALYNVPVTSLTALRFKSLLWAPPLQSSARRLVLPPVS